MVGMLRKSGKRAFGRLPRGEVVLQIGCPLEACGREKPKGMAFPNVPSGIDCSTIKNDQTAAVPEQVEFDVCRENAYYQVVRNDPEEIDQSDQPKFTY